MDAKELMIGDWVNLSPGDYPVRNYVKIHAIDYDYKVGKDYVCDIAFLSTGAIQYNYSMRVLKPIQLTPEILAKNAEHRTISGGYALTRSVAIRPISDEAFGVYGVMVGFAELPVRISYVHELQHALKLCRIEKDIVL